MIIGLGDSIGDSLSDFFYVNADGSDTVLDNVLNAISGATNSVENAAADTVGTLFPQYSDSNANQYLALVLSAGPSVPSDASLASNDMSVIYGDISAGTQKNYVNAANQGFANAAAAQAQNKSSSLTTWLLIGGAVGLVLILRK